MTRRAFVFSSSAAHSLSPVMHNAAFRALGLDARYEAVGLEEADLPEAVAKLRAADVYGANVTIPHKVAVMPLMDDLTPEAQLVGAVNTVVNRGGTLTGHNTDGGGFMQALLEDAGYDPGGREVVILGAGGSARAVGLALVRAGAALGVYNRTQAKAEALAEVLGRHGNVGVVRAADLERSVRRASLVVNTTSVGHETYAPGASPLQAGVLPRELVVDIVYRPAETPLLRAAAEAGLRTQNGLAMLVYQGAEAFGLWTNQAAPVGAMVAALREALG